ncbi:MULTISPECIES: MFS transporter [Paenibacillus]|uniref:MFS transporter n=1 Tax=Paenibacillus TaxID=44249 RepID=UPI00096DAA72|nr:MFS transporter [Paenibacillus odorifer]MEC0131431.1 MFS transporter [Paenibacillus odorifer]MEC0220415.1 MFS transporter [Paenibacillus odorifer]OMD03106.1 MFS transporter [Paenibacillus odorifer]OMD12082.1 MFS transporter [Paenibacillus odorifer]OME48818.1 MFS transporter [Paenibacillus odorifer]
MKKLIWIGCLSYFVIGLAHVVLGSILPVLLQHYDQNYSAGGELIFSQFAGFLAGVLVSPLLNRRFGKRGGILIATSLLIVAEVAYAFLPPWGWMYFIAVAAGFGFGMIEAVIGTIIIGAVTEGTAIAMSRLEVLFGIGALVMPLIASPLIAAGAWRLAFLIVAAFSLISLILWARGHFGNLQRMLDERASVQGADNSHSSSSRSNKKFPYKGKQWILLGIFIVFFFLYVGTEMSLVNFMPAIFIAKLGMTESAAALTVTFFWLAMSTGRLFAGVIAEKISYRVYILSSCLLTLLLLTLFPFTENRMAAFIVILLLGLFMSGIFSIALVFSSKMLPGTEESTPSIMIASGGVGGALLPLFTGWSMDHLEVAQTAGLLATFAAFLFLLSIAAWRFQARQAVEGKSSRI